MRRSIWILLVVALVAAGAYIFIVNRPKPSDDTKLLRTQLTLLRDSLTQFHKVRGRYPKELNELVTAGVLEAIPPDPVTKSTTTWRVIRQRDVRLDDFREGSLPSAASDDEIVDIRSGAGGYDDNGIAWSEY